MTRYWVSEDALNDPAFKGGVTREVCLASDLPAHDAQLRAQVWEEAAKVAETEPELPGKLPVYVRLELEKLSLEEQQRAAVRSTKKSIAAALRQRGVDKRDK